MAMHTVGVTVTEPAIPISAMEYAGGGNLLFRHMIWRGKRVFLMNLVQLKVLEASHPAHSFCWAQSGWVAPGLLPAGPRRMP